MSHTPGPWCTEEEVIIERTGRVGSVYVSFFDDKHMRPDGRICQVFANCLVTSDAAVRANARLIAAAPDLLEALTLLNDAINGKGNPIDVAIKVSNAIAKAEGR